MTKYYQIINELGDNIHQTLTYQEAVNYRNLLEDYFTDFFLILEIEL